MSRENETCCDAFAEMIPTFKWFSTTDQNPKLFLMPCIASKTTANMLRVNHCPSCGAEVRNIQITENRMRKICEGVIA